MVASRGVRAPDNPRRGLSLGGAALSNGNTAILDGEEPRSPLQRATRRDADADRPRRSAVNSPEENGADAGPAERATRWDPELMDLVMMGDLDQPGSGDMMGQLSMAAAGSDLD